MFTNLNENEIKVLKQVRENIKECTGGEFGYADEVLNKIKGLSANQVKGYLSQLQQKNRINIADDDYDGQTFLINKDNEIIWNIDNEKDWMW